jgi:imidazoleglycerol phosphate synthase glutamine amidotransferase subunit HisH
MTDHGGGCRSGGADKLVGVQFHPKDQSYGLELLARWNGTRNDRFSRD